MSTEAFLGGIDVREMQIAHAQHPGLSQWRETSQIVIRNYVEAKAALEQKLDEAEAKEAELEQHIVAVEQENEALRRELEPEEAEE